MMRLPLRYAQFSIQWKSSSVPRLRRSVSLTRIASYSPICVAFIIHGFSSLRTHGADVPLLTSVVAWMTA